MPYVNELEQKLVEQGISSFDIRTKNELIALLANKEGVSYSHITDEYLLEYHKQLKISFLNETCEQQILQGFTAANGHIYRTNINDQINLIGQKDELMANEAITQVAWKTEDIGYILHTREEWLDIYLQAFAYKKEQLMRYNTVKIQALLAERDEDIVAVQWVPVEEPIVEEPIIEEPIVEQPIEEPTTEPVEEPIMEEPVTETPIEEPVTEEPAQEPAPEEPIMQTQSMKRGRNKK